MKLIITLIVGLLLFTVPAFSELTQADIDKIRLIVKEEVAVAVAASKSRVQKYVEASETRMKDHVSDKIETVRIEIREMDKRLNQIFAMVIGLVALIVVVVGVPQILVALQRKDMRAQDEKIEAQQKQIEALQQEMEMYRQERIARP